MTQSKKGSAAEAVINVAVGFGIALLSQIVIFPLYDIHVSLKTDLMITLWFTGISLVRSYCLRRWFNGFARRAGGK